MFIFLGIGIQATDGRILGNLMIMVGISNCWIIQLRYYNLGINLKINYLQSEKNVLHNIKVFWESYLS